MVIATGMVVRVVGDAPPVVQLAFSPKNFRHIWIVEAVSPGRGFRGGLRSLPAPIEIGVEAYAADEGLRRIDDPDEADTRETEHEKELEVV